MDYNGQDLGSIICRRLKRLEGDRSHYETTWDEICRYMLPSRVFRDRYSPGQKRNNQLYDVQAMLAANTLATELSSTMTNSAMQWYELEAENPALNQSYTNKLWFQKATEVVVGVMASDQSAFESASYEWHKDLIVVGNGTMTAQESNSVQSPVVYSTVAPVEVYFEVNSFGQITAQYRVFEQNLEEVMLYPNVPDTVRQDFKDKKEGKTYKIINCVYSRGHFDGKQISDREYHSVYVFYSDKTILREDQYYSLPMWTARLNKRSGENYGMGLGHDALPVAKLLNNMARQAIEAAELSIRPPMMMPDNSFLKPLSLGPATLNYYRASMSPDAVRPLNSGADLRAGADLLEYYGEQVRQAFHLDWIMPPRKKERQTAQEFNSYDRARLRRLAPMLARVEAEGYTPVIQRTFDICNRKRLLPELPPELANSGYKIKYKSAVALSKRSDQIEGMLMALQQSMPLLQIDPSVRNNMDLDMAVRKIWDLSGAPIEILRKPEEVEKLRDAERKLAAEQQALQNMQQLAGAAQQGGQALASLSQ